MDFKKWQSQALMVFSAYALMLLCTSRAAHGQTTLGGVVFNNNQFGNSVVASDGGAAANSNWLNTAGFVNPGSPAYLTGANFETGVANIATESYTITYNTPIVNGVGTDLAIVGGYDTFSTFGITLSVSTNGSTFSSPVTYLSGAIASGVTKNYYYGANNSGTFPTQLFVLPVNLSDFGISSGASVVAIRASSSPSGGADLIRIAGTSVPEPASLSVLGTVACLISRRRRYCGK